MKKLITTSLFIMFVLNIYGQSFSVDSINYTTLTTTTVEVTGYITPCKSNLAIPSTVTYNAVTYNVTSIGVSAFMDCKSLNSIIIPSFVTTIGNSAFSGCTNLTSVTLPASVISIGLYSFSGCVGLNSVIIPDSVTSIGSYAFLRCTGLTSVTFSASLLTIGSYAFYGCTGLSSVSLPSLVISIGTYAFSSCTGLTSVTIPASVSTIGNYTFLNCSGLINVDNANINYSSLEGVLYDITKTQLIQCPISKNGSFVIPSSVKTIGSSAFRNCSDLTSVTIPSSVLSILSGAFVGCIGLTSVTIPASVTSIGNYAFANCSGLITVDNSNPNYSSLEGVMYNKAITQLIQCPISKGGNFIVPLSVNTIGTEAYSNCTSLTSVTIPASVTSIGNYAFYRCSGSINVDNANPNYSSVEGVLYNKNKTQLIQCPISKSGSFVIPSSVKNIVSNSFCGCTVLSTITIPASVTYIGSNAFRDCVGLTSVTVNSRPIITVNSTDMFYNSNNENCVLYVPFGTKSLYKGCYWNYYFPNIVENTQGFFLEAITVNLWASAGSNAKVNINANVVWTASSDQTWLILNPISGTDKQELTFTAEANSSISTRTANVTVAASGFEPQYITITQVGMITSYAVTAGGLASTLSAEQLSSIVKLKLTGSIDARDFKTMRDYMPLLSELDLSDVSVKSYSGTDGPSGTAYKSYPSNEIPEYSFYIESTQVGKLSLKAIALPSFVTSIGNYAFYKSQNLNWVTIPSTLTTLGSHAFGFCNSLTSIDIPSSLTTIESYAFYGTGFTSFTIPNSVTTIKNHAFYFCINLTSINIPSSVISIGDYAFRTCNKLISITIPSSVTSLGVGAFSDCSGLTSVYVNALIPIYLTSSSIVFYGVDKTKCTLYVPTGSKGLYQSAVEWKDFTNIVELATATPTIEKDKISVYLNPNDETIRIKGIEGTYMAFLFDINGRVLINKKINENGLISITSYPKGVYIIKLITEKGNFERKLIKR